MRRRYPHPCSSPNPPSNAPTASTSSLTLPPFPPPSPEITDATRGVLDTLTSNSDFTISYRDALIGGAAIDAANDPFPQETYDACVSGDSVLLACIGGYKWDSNPREMRPETGLLKMRSR